MKVSPLPNQLANVLLVALSTFVVASAEMDTGDHGLKLIEWLRSRGGAVNENIEIRRADPSDPTSRFGMFSNGDIAEDEVILNIPNECLIHALVEEGEEEAESYDSPMQCATVRSLIKEMRLGDDSFYAPYVNYLLAEPWGQLPSAWSDPGKELFRSILENHTSRPIPPVEPDDWLDEWYEECEGSDDPFEENAALMIIQRSWDDVLIPVFDMMSHRNPPYLNTKSNTVHGDEPVIVTARKPIKAGDEIYTSYNMCEDCGGRAETYGTPDILRDYGFVEQFPQRWIFFQETSFQIDEYVEGSGDLSVSWVGEMPTVDTVDFLKDIQAGMKKAAETDLANPSDKVTAGELESIRFYHKSLTTAIDLALESAYQEDEACSAAAPTCKVQNTRYVDFFEEFEEPHLGKTCDTDIFMQFEGYEDTESVQSQYQTMSFNHAAETRDVCFDLDNTVQICTSYRPHYHEPSVHWGARYFQNIKRVLFVGGGDSMLLHEILKYPTLEKVVGLELDQKVTRNCFKHFGTQPHWDNDKVEWWFGDATKSLLMLPKEYFGSFDMVLVDLSETVMSLTVTGELDIMEALSLLLTPEGFMLKNELYFDGMSDIFEHTVMLHYSDVPVICSQAMVLGSNKIDFLSENNLTGHKVENYLLGDTLETDRHFGIVHSYTKNEDNIKKHCKKENDELEKVSLRQTKSPGITMIVEAEGATIESIEELEDLKELVEGVVTEQGFSVVSTVLPNDDDEFDAVTVMDEGFVSINYWQDLNYFAIDIHLWSHVEKQDGLKKALVSAIGSEGPVSSFRVVAGGMFGLESWKEEESKRGPRRTNPCTPPEPEVTKTDLSPAVLGDVLATSMDILPEDGDVVAVICGKKDSGSCTSLDALKKKGGDIIEMWSCPVVSEYDENSGNDVYACEQEVKETLRKGLAGGKKLRSVVFDADIPYPMGQIFIRIFKNLKTNLEFLTESTSVVGVSFEDNSWFGNFISIFRTEVHIMEPAFEGVISVKGADKSAKVYMATSDSSFLRKLQGLAKTLSTDVGVVAKIVDLRGGQTTDENNDNFVPSRIYRPEDYPQEDGLKQFATQQELEYQTIVQLEKTKTKLTRSKLQTAIASGLDEDVTLHTFGDLGDGGLFVALATGIRLIVLWDGRDHIDINLAVEDDGNEFANNFVDNIIESIPALSVSLRDEMPRGHGRVINFSESIKDLDIPLWG